MARTASSAGPSRSPGGGGGPCRTNSVHQQQQQQQQHGQASSSASVANASTSLPQCKVKRNYTCPKCNYHTQNPRTFLSHQRIVHNERIKVFECSYCLYASKHSQKLQRHVHMVHTNSRKAGGGDKDAAAKAKDAANKIAAAAAAAAPTPLVPPVRIRVRFEKHAVVRPQDEVDGVPLMRVVDERTPKQEPRVEQAQEEEEEEEVEEEEEEEEEAEDEDEEGGEEEEEEVEDENNEETDGSGCEEEEEEEEDGEETVSTAMNDDTQSPRGDATAASVQPSRQTAKRKKRAQEKQPAAFIRCSVCAYGSHSQMLVNKHEKTAHLKKKFFRCMKCNYVTHMRARYTKHVKYHTMPMIKCADCDFQTPYKWNLDRHNRNHSAASPGTYKCSHCSFSADIKQSLTVHETNHHVPPVGAVQPAADPAVRRYRRYRVGASDAPGSAVDGTEIVTYETKTNGGVIEIMTETKSTSPTAVKSAAETAVKSEPVKNEPVKGERKEPAAKRRPMPQLIPLAATKAVSPPQAPRATPDDAACVKTTAENAPPGNVASLGNGSYGPAASTSGSSGLFVDCGASEDARERRSASSVRSSTSPKGKTASFFDKLKARVDDTADLTCQVCRHESKCLSEFMRHQRTHETGGGGGGDDESVSSSSSPPRTSVPLPPLPQLELLHTPLPPPMPVTAAELKSTRCQRCRKRCKTSTELVTHLATCRGSVPNLVQLPVAAVTPAVESTDVAGTEDTDLVVQHPIEKKIFVWNTAAAVRLDADDDGAAAAATEEPAADSAGRAEAEPLPLPPSTDERKRENKRSREDKRNRKDRKIEDARYRRNEKLPTILPKPVIVKLEDRPPQQQLQPVVVRKEGKMYKTVFKCPHCTFWAATASRFHVHIVGHLNRKPFECSCCAYRSNWRWDITKHIRLKSARRLGLTSESPAAANSHLGAKVLMTDETGRRNYSKYNRYLTVMEMDYADGADNSVAGGDFDDGKAIAFRKVVGGTPPPPPPPPRRRRVVNKNDEVVKQQPAALTLYTTTVKPGKMPSTGRVQQQQQQQQLPTGRVQQQPTTGRVQQPPQQSTGGGSPPKKLKIIKQSETASADAAAAAESTPPPKQPPTPWQTTPAAGGDNRSKTVWKCKKCLFRDCNRLTVLNHVKAHYRRGDFTAIPSGCRQKQQSNGARNQKRNEKEKTSEPSDTATGEHTPSADHRKIKTPTTGTTNETTLMLSTNPKSYSHYKDDTPMSCPLCQVSASSSTQLKEHMQCIHIPEGTKYRCEYCPFWSEQKKDMLDHMVYAHEMDDDNHAGKTSNCYRNDPWEETGSNHEDVFGETRDPDDDPHRSDDDDDDDDVTATAANSEEFDDGEDRRSSSTASHSASALGDENIFVVEYDPSVRETMSIDADVNAAADDHEDAVAMSGHYDEESGGSADDSRMLVMNEDADGGSENDAKDDEEEAKDDEEDIVKDDEEDKAKDDEEEEEAKDEQEDVEEEEAKEPNKNGIKIVEAVVPRTPATDAVVVHTTRAVYKCPDCWYFSTDKRDMNAHRRLHVKRGALYNCSKCVFNVSRADVLYHHYRYGHGVEEPELRYPEESVVRAGHRDVIVKNKHHLAVDDGNGKDAANNDDDDEEAAAAAAGPPMVWNYRPDAEPQYSKMFMCRYCPHTNRRRHNTIEHERMHSDHPDHQHHRQLQQRTSSPSSSVLPMHPCKRCTYVCNNAGVLASHVKVHSVENSVTIVGFYDVEIFDAMQVQALEYVMDLERCLSLDDSGGGGGENRADTGAAGVQENAVPLDEFSETDKPELKFCPHCPARFFFLSDLLCHMRYHKYRAWPHACQQCTFVACAAALVESHANVHGDEYAKRTAELVAGFRVSKQYPKPKWNSFIKRKSDGVVRLSPKFQIVAETSVPATDDDDVEERKQDERQKQRRRIKKQSRSETEDSEETAAVQWLLSTSLNEHEVEKNNEEEKMAVDDCPEPVVAVKTEAVADAPKSTPAKIGKFKCEKCPGRFFKASALQYHKTLHGGDGPHRCRECDYAVSTCGNLIKHESVHENLPPRENKVSNSGRKVKSGVVTSPAAAVVPRRPRDRAATGNGVGSDAPGSPFFYPTTVINGVARSKRYKCPKCPSAFDKRNQYSVHLTLHGAGDKLQCDKCDYSVRYTANYVQHQRKHARDAELRKNHSERPTAPEQPGPVDAKNGDDGPREPKTKAPVCHLDPRNTVFRNEISDRQMAYELNAAYGPTMQPPTVPNGRDDWVRCPLCPYECGTPNQLKLHVARHVEGGGSKAPAFERSKLQCRFCTYCAHDEHELTEHSRVHFVRATGVILSSLAALNTSVRDTSDYVAATPSDHVEYHGKRVDCRSQRTGHDGKPANGTAEGGVDDDDDDEPFLVFRDEGANGGGAKRFSPDAPIPPVLIDFNDNRTDGGDGDASADKTTCRRQTTALVRIINRGKVIEFVDDRPKEETVLGKQQLGDKNKTGKKHRSSAFVSSP